MKNLKFIFNTIIFIGAVILFGAAGMSDVGELSLGKLLESVAVASSFILFGVWGRYSIKKAEAYILKIKRRGHINMAIAKTV